MNEMYSMGLSLHSIGTIGVLVAIFLNLFLLISYQDLKKYKRLNSIVIWPLTFTLLSIVIFTGVIMMAAKHLDFTLANIAMIIVSIIMIVLEAKRMKTLKYLSETKEHAFNAYKPIARTILQIEFLLVLVLSIWMWLL
jgi:SNF family Na+-dependent transporter